MKTLPHAARSSAPPDQGELFSGAAPGPQDSGPFDSARFERERKERIEASRRSGAIHLDQIKPYVETMRGKRISDIHQEERGIIETVDRHSTVYVRWETGMLAVGPGILMPSDFKDYVVENPHEQLDPQAFAELRRKWAKADARR